MHIIAFILMAIGMALTVGVLFMGLFSMTRGGAFNDKWGNRLMRYRIVAQLFALAMFALGVFMLKGA